MLPSKPLSFTFSSKPHVGQDPVFPQLTMDRAVVVVDCECVCMRTSKSQTNKRHLKSRERENERTPSANACAIPKRGTLRDQSGLKWMVRQIFPPLYIFDVFPSSSGSWISGAVDGYVTGIWCTKSLKNVLRNMYVCMRERSTNLELQFELVFHALVVVPTCPFPKRPSRIRFDRKPIIIIGFIVLYVLDKRLIFGFQTFRPLGRSRTCNIDRRFQ